MGTRADFYTEDMTWLGSIAWDGYPSAIDIDVLRSTTDAVFVANVQRFLASRDDSTLPDRGWPWPWNDSGTTDYAYLIRDGAVHASNFGSPFFRIDLEDESLGHPAEDELTGPAPDFPDMSSQMNTRFDRGSGVLILGIGGPS